MDWKTAAVSLVKATVWPILLAIIFFQLRGQIRDLVGRIVKASGYGVELNFADDADKVKALADAALPKKVEMAFDAALVERPSLILYDNPLAPARPRYIVEQVWSWVKGCLEADAKTRGFAINGYVAAGQLGRRLKLPEPLLEALDGLERLRNEVTQTPIPPLSHDDAQRYREAAESFISKL